MDKNNLRLIIADDEIAIRKGLSTLIEWESLGVEVVGIAKDGKDALDMITQLNPDIVITDIKMPFMSGLEVIERARELNLNSEFIILSGYEDFSYAKRAINSRVSEYLLKPINPDMLINSVVELIKRIKPDAQNKKNDETVNKRSVQIISEQFYTMLALNEYNSETQAVTAQMQLNCISFPPPCVAVMVKFTLPEIADVAHFSIKDRRLFKFALRNVVEELYQDEFVIFYGDALNSLGFIIGNNKQNCDTLTRCINTMNTISPMQLSAGVGISANTYMQLADSCNKAQEMAEYHMYESDIQIFYASDFTKSEDLPPKMSPPTKSIAKAILEGNKDDLNSELTQFIDAVFYTQLPPPKYVRGMCVYCVINTYKMLAELTNQELPASFSSWINEIENFVTFSGVKQYMLSEFYSLSKSLRKNKRANIPQPVLSAQEYIQNNTLAKIMVEDVAAYVHLSESHFALVFKKHTGVTVRDYIISCKLEKAKELLLSKAYNVMEIAEMLEYSDYRSFSRAFKKHYGYSPTEFQSAVFNIDGVENND